MLIGNYNHGRPKIMTVSESEYRLIVTEEKILGYKKISELSSDYAIALLI
jgi:hypothetical protein